MEKLSGKDSTWVTSSTDGVDRVVARKLGQAGAGTGAWPRCREALASSPRSRPAAAPRVSLPPTLPGVRVPSEPTHSRLYRAGKTTHLGERREARSAAPGDSDHRFAPDSPLEQAGFELWVPPLTRRLAGRQTPRPTFRSVHGGTGGSNPLCSSGESSANLISST
jgi:hypothetical protein